MSCMQHLLGNGWLWEGESKWCSEYEQEQKGILGLEELKVFVEFKGGPSLSLSPLAAAALQQGYRYLSLGLSLSQVVTARTFLLPPTPATTNDHLPKLLHSLSYEYSYFFLYYSSLFPVLVLWW